MTASIPIDNLIRSVPFSQAEWERTPSTVQAHLVALDTTVSTLEAELQQQVDQLQGRLDQTSSTSSKPPSSDSPFKPRKPRQSSGQRAQYGPAATCD